MGRRMDERSRMEAAVAAQQDSGPAWTRRAALGLVGGLIGMAAAPALASPYVPRIGPRTNHIVISKSNRVMELRQGKEILKRYRIGLGFTPTGHKVASGDGRTPEGRYWVDRRNPRSQYFLSVGISYPNQADVARARALGVSPGGDIFIHGEPMIAAERNAAKGKQDWTAGCVAVTNGEIEEIWAMTPLGVPVTILA